MFYDWLKISQEFDTVLPLVSDRAYQNIHVETSELGAIVQPRFKHKGSFCTSISIQISGNRLTVEGNPSRYNRLDNLIGYSSLDQCVSVYNEILGSLGLPHFTKCTKVNQLTINDNSVTVDGAVIQNLHITSNYSTSAPRDYVRGLSTLRYKNSIPRLHTNGNGCDWLSEKGNAYMMYNKAYIKANEMIMYLLPKIKRNYGENSDEFLYVEKLVNYCVENGVVRLEQELHSPFLRRHNLRFWGLVDENNFKNIHSDFVNLDKSLCVEALEMQSISEKLITCGVCESTRSAMATTMYALEWANGKRFDFDKRQVKTHRARLRKIGIDIKNEFDASRFSPVYVEKAAKVSVEPLHRPDWYRMPASKLQLKVA